MNEIRRRRVFFDEILLVTLHSTSSLVISILPPFLGLLFALAGLGARDEPSASYAFWTVAAFFLALGVAMAFVSVWVVTVFGKRTRARMHFRLRQTKAREVYAEICRAAADAQRALILRLASRRPSSGAAPASSAPPSLGPPAAPSRGASSLSLEPPSNRRARVLFKQIYRIDAYTRTA